MGYASTFMLLAFAGVCAIDPTGAYQVVDTVGYGVLNGAQKIRQVLDRHISDAPIPEPRWVKHYGNDGEMGAAAGGTAGRREKIAEHAQPALPPLERPTNDPGITKPPDAALRQGMIDVAEACLIKQFGKLYDTGLRGWDLGQQATGACEIQNHGLLTAMPAGDARRAIVDAMELARQWRPDIGF